MGYALRASYKTATAVIAALGIMAAALSAPPAQAAANPFTGTYNGTIHLHDGGPSYPISMQVGGAGAVTGTISYPGYTCSISGSVTVDGKTVIKYGINADTYQYQGPLAKFGSQTSGVFGLIHNGRAEQTYDVTFY